MDPWASRILLNKPSLPVWNDLTQPPLEKTEKEAQPAASSVTTDLDFDVDFNFDDVEKDLESDEENLGDILADFQSLPKVPGLDYITEYLKANPGPGPSSLKGASRVSENGSIRDSSTVQHYYSNNWDSNLDEDFLKNPRNVTSFQKFKVDAPTPNFTGRGLLLERLHTLMTASSRKNKFWERTILLHGLAGMGKTEVARMYAELYIDSPIIQNIAWINAQNTHTLKASFLALAERLHLQQYQVDKIKTGGVKDIYTPSNNVQIQDSSVEKIIKDVYKHFSDHIQKGLFIFDNASASSSREALSQILKFLPAKVSHLKHYPLALIISRDKDVWEDYINTKENILLIDTLSKDESLGYLSILLPIMPLEGATVNLYKNVNEMNAVLNLARTLQGYPQALFLAASNICHNTDMRIKIEIDMENGTHLLKEIQNYVQNLNLPEPKGRWIHNHQDGQKTRGAGAKYELILKKVLFLSLKNIRDTYGDDGETALVLLNLISYLPRTSILRDRLRSVLKFLFDTKLRKKTISKSTGILKKFGLLTICKGRDFPQVPGAVKMRGEIQIQEIIQKCVRDRLDSYRYRHPDSDIGGSENFSSSNSNRTVSTRIGSGISMLTSRTSDPHNKNLYLFGLCTCASQSLYNRDSYFAETALGLHRHLKERSWPSNSIQYSIIFISQLIQSDLSTAWEILQEVYEHFFKNEIRQILIMNENFSHLLQGCLYYFRSHKDKKVMSEHKIFKRVELSKNNLKKKFRCNLEMYLKHLVIFEFENINNNYQNQSDISTLIETMSMANLAAQYSYQVTFFTLKNRFAKFNKFFQEEIGHLLISNINSSVGSRLESVKEIYYILWQCYQFNRNIYSRVEYLKGIVKVHNEIYSTFNRDSVETLSLYWEEMRPLPYHFIWNSVVGMEGSNAKSLFSDLFIAQGGPQILVHHLEFLSRPMAMNDDDEMTYLDCEDLLDFILRMSYDCKCAQKFVETPKFMETLHIFTSRIFELGDHSAYSYQLSCLTTWFGLFSKNENFLDGHNINWSIASVENEMNEFLLGLKSQGQNVSRSSGISTAEKKREILDSFLGAVVIFGGSRGSVAVHTATIMLELLR